jgi:hypothetical protein
LGQQQLTRLVEGDDDGSGGDEEAAEGFAPSEAFAEEECGEDDY